MYFCVIIGLIFDIYIKFKYEFFYINLIEIALTIVSQHWLLTINKKKGEVDIMKNIFGTG